MHTSCSHFSSETFPPSVELDPGQTESEDKHGNGAAGLTGVRKDSATNRARAFNCVRLSVEAISKRRQAGAYE
jgi:hypothetical protein